MKQSLKLILLVVLYGAQFASAQIVTDVTDITDYPYAAFIEFIGGSGNGAIISDTQVLSSASALNVHSGGMITVYVGNATVRQGPKFTTRTYRVHPSYNPATLENNMAIVTIDGTFKGVPNVQPIAIRSSALVNPISCFSIGWGLYTTTGTTSLRRVNYQLVSDQACATTFSSVPSTVQCASANKGSGRYETNAFPLICDNRLYGVLSATSTYAFTAAQPVEMFTKLTATSIKDYLSTLIPRRNYIGCD